MAFKMKYSPNKKTGEGFPYKTPLNIHKQDHDPLSENIRDTSDLSNEQIEALKEEEKSANIGPVESPKMLAEKKELAEKETVGPSGTVFDADEEDIDKDYQEKKDYQEAKKYIKK